MTSATRFSARAGAAAATSMKKAATNDSKRVMGPDPVLKPRLLVISRVPLSFGSKGGRASRGQRDAARNHVDHGTPIAPRGRALHGGSAQEEARRRGNEEAQARANAR